VNFSTLIGVIGVVAPQKFLLKSSYDLIGIDNLSSNEFSSYLIVLT
jgi:hypothetical protein